MNNDQYVVSSSKMTSKVDLLHHSTTTMALYKVNRAEREINCWDITYLTYMWAMKLNLSK